MTEHDRFADFLRREGASYHEPPEAPLEAMWGEIAEALEAHAAAAAEPDVSPAEGGVPVGAGAPATPGAYHEPPETPREAMWRRIEPAWALRREAATSGTGGAAGRDRRSVAMWITGLAVAASLAIGIALGRGTVVFGGSGPQVAMGPEGSTPVATDATGDAASGAIDPRDVLPLDAGSPEIEPLETSVQLAVDPSARTPDRTPTPATDAPDARTPAERPDRRAVAARYATAAHLGRAETLLTAFRTDATPDDGQRELAGWARELLGETRLLLDMSVERSPTERRVLEQLELLLAQIARLGPGAPDFERDLITEGLERQGTITQLRAMTSTVGT